MNSSPLRSRKVNGRVGLGVDAFGGGVIDPTANVRALNEASNTRQDDLREANNKLYDSQHAHLEDMMILRSEHYKEIRELESNRLNAIRQVDVLASQTLAASLERAVQALAANNAKDAETLRNLVKSTSDTLAAQTGQQMSQFSERISALEKSSYEGAGRQQYSDPAMVALAEEMKKIGQAQAAGAGQSKGIGQSWAVLLGVAALVAALMSIYNQGKAPQVVYSPSPGGIVQPVR